MKKKYISKSDISVNVRLENGKNVHVSFSPKTTGGSVYYTDVEEIQTALEKHHRFGTLFKVDTTFDESAVKVQPKKEVVDVNAPKKVHISDPDSAKAYLSEKFGISRTRMKTLKAIKDEAIAHNIEFVGL